MSDSALQPGKGVTVTAGQGSWARVEGEGTRVGESLAHSRQSSAQAASLELERSGGWPGAGALRQLAWSWSAQATSLELERSGGWPGAGALRRPS